MEFFNVARRMQLLNLLRRKRIHERTAECVLYPGQLMLLEAVIDHPGIAQQALSASLGVTPASVAQSVKRLSSSGLIAKRTDPASLRRNQLFATDEGRRAAQLYRKNFDAVDAETFRGFTDGELKTIEGCLDRMIANLADSDVNIEDFLSERNFRHD